MSQLAQLIALMDSVSPSSVTTLVLMPLPKGAALVAVNPDCTVRLNAPGLVLNGLTAPMAVDSKTLLGALKNRECSLSVSGTEVTVQSGKSYAATVACSDEVPALPEGLAKLDDDNQVTVGLTQDQLIAIKSLVSRVRIERTFTGIVDTLVAVRATPKTLTVMNYEPSQVASVSVKNELEIPDCFFVLPAAVFTKTLNLVGPMRVTLGDSCAIFQSKSCVVRVNLPIDTINAINKDDVLKLVESVRKAGTDTPSLVTTRSALSGFLDNAESLISVNSDVVVAPATGGFITASVTTAKGSVKEKFKGTAANGFSLGYAFMRAILGKVKDGADVELRTTDSFAVVKTGPVTYVASLSEG